MRQVTIYGIRAVGTDQYLYVGATTDMRRRKRVGYVASRVAAALDGLAWEMAPLESCGLAESAKRESFWITKLTTEGHALANVAKPIKLLARRIAPKSSSGTPGTHANKGVLIRAPADEQAAWQRAADAAGQKRSEWIRAALRRASALVR